jgi:hypothetical protein
MLSANGYSKYSRFQETGVADRVQRLARRPFFEGEFSDVSRSYAGKGVARYAW